MTVSRGQRSFIVGAGCTAFIKVTSLSNVWKRVVIMLNSYVFDSQEGSERPRM